MGLVHHYEGCDSVGPQHLTLEPETEVTFTQESEESIKEAFAYKIAQSYEPPQRIHSTVHLPEELPPWQQWQQWQA